MKLKQIGFFISIAIALTSVGEKTVFAAMLPPSRIYVDSYAHGANNGSSWSNAFRDLQDALAVPVPGNGNEIWVASGTYYPADPAKDGVASIATSFVLNYNVKLYGGFLGTRHASGGETSLSQRDFDANPTILSGDIYEPYQFFFPRLLQSNAALRRSRHVVVIADGSGALPRLDGLIVTKGQAYWSGSTAHWNKGGGLYSDSSEAIVANCTFKENEAKTSGGAVCFENPNYWILGNFENCKFLSNRTDGNGGAMDFSGLGFVLTNCEFRNNSAANDGGAIVCYFDQDQDYSSQDFQLTNCLVAQNNAGGIGGGIYVRGDLLRLFNSTVANNQAGGAGGGVYVAANGTGESNYAWVSSSILWGNRGVTGFQEKDQLFAASNQGGLGFSLVQGWTGTSWPSADTIGGNPRFASVGDGNFQLTVGSPCLDNGSEEMLPPDFSDLDGDGDTEEPIPDLLLNPRVVNHSSTSNTGFEGSVIDMGCYELPDDGSGDGQ